MTTKIQLYGWCCDDCLFWLANGETPVDMDETATEEWLAKIAANLGSWHVDLGGEHVEGCPNVDQETGEWIGASNCDCEQVGFSWSRCDVCRSSLGGSRDAVHFWTEEENNG